MLQHSNAMQCNAMQCNTMHARVRYAYDMWPEPVAGTLCARCADGCHVMSGDTQMVAGGCCDRPVITQTLCSRLLASYYYM
jgi:hypothetical protein